MGTCEICKKDFKNQRYLTRHKNMVHSKPSVKEKTVKETPPPPKKASIWKCTTCGQEFARLNFLVLHQKSHIKLSLSLRKRLKNLNRDRKRKQNKRKDKTYLNKEKEVKREKRKDKTYLKKEISAMREKRKD